MTTEKYSTTCEDDVQPKMKNDTVDPTKHPAFDAGGMLRHDVHLPLVRDLDRVCEVAGIPRHKQHLVWTPLSESVDDGVRTWFDRYNTPQRKGLLLVGDAHRAHEDMMALAGAFIRNYVDARLLPVQGLTQALMSGSAPEPTVALVPDLHSHRGAPMADFKIALLGGWLTDVYHRDGTAVVHVSNWKQFKSAFGEDAAGHVRTRYSRIVYEGG